MNPQEEIEALKSVVDLLSIQVDKLSKRVKALEQNQSTLSSHKAEEKE